MPLYEYRCDTCGKTIEVIQKFSDEPLTVHDACGGVLEKLISRSALQFKGSGWYVTDYGKGGVVPKNPDGKSGESGSSEGAKPSESKSDSKQESKGSSESKSSESKSSESKSSDSKSSDSAPKPSAPAPAPAAG